jgi:hypothetical protein
VVYCRGSFHFVKGDTTWPQRKRKVSVEAIGTAKPLRLLRRHRAPRPAPTRMMTDVAAVAASPHSSGTYWYRKLHVFLHKIRAVKHPSPSFATGNFFMHSIRGILLLRCRRAPASGGSRAISRMRTVGRFGKRVRTEPNIFAMSGDGAERITDSMEEKLRSS